MVYGASAISNLPASSYALSSYASSRLSFPVAPSAYIYAQFEHVSGVPVPEGGRGVAVSKLKILDVLIDQLSKIKQKPEPTYAAGGRLDDGQVDALIEQYETQIRGARAASAAMPYRSAPAAPAGLLFNLVA
jgi:hypothetical protein